jgi:ribosomal protein S18 acetylase RimI-like enzyme
LAVYRVHKEVMREMTNTGGAYLSLRSASEIDIEFLRTVFESTREQEFAQTGWSVERVTALLADQFSMQHEYYRRHYPHGRFDVVMRGKTAIGRFYHDWQGAEARLIDIALLPAYRRGGIGGRLVRAFVAQAAARAMAAVLYVEIDNPVQELYRRLGFEAVGENGVYLQMRRAAAPFIDESVVPVPGLAAEGAM